MAEENQRYGRNKDTLINRSYIESGKYRRKFDGITDKAEVNRILYLKAKEMLYHRSGTLFEDMYWINADTGKVAACALNEKTESAVLYSRSIKRAIYKKNNIIAMHTHPQSMPPSITDFNSAYANNYRIGIVICHDGKVFCYNAHETIRQGIYINYISRFALLDTNEYESQIMAIRKLQQNYMIDFWEVI